ncbi:Transposable element P transposase [Amphibalanus amphitrite]|uniref:Transposable element P transposase n=1 Tax=Amphibalanus amphitrite TaxID=1232801 RepID=A0A6A4W2L2_AMPAM|nr:Transposable element P transposase [Amphibalanus amphitrite]
MLLKTAAPKILIFSGFLVGQVIYVLASVLKAKKRPYRWDDDTIHRAVEIRAHASRRLYCWLRERYLPLPSLTTIQNWLSRIVLEPKSSKTQLILLERLLATMPERDRHCTIMMDEMDIMGLVTYDQQMDQMLGPFKHLQVFLVCGIFSSWKLPVMFAFNQPVTKELFLDLIGGV